MNSLDYRIGLDIGTNSIGWSVIEVTENENKTRFNKVGIVDHGVRMFSRAEHPKTGASLAAPRRLARSSRRRLNRKSGRKEAVRKLLILKEVIGEQELNALYPLSANSIDVWNIRLDALDRMLTRAEWSRLLIHLVQKRGFKSNRKSDRKDDETGKVLTNISANEELLSSYRTVGEMWMKDPKFSVLGRRRNTMGEYLFNVSRDALKDEINRLFVYQQQFGSPYASNELLEEYLKIWEHQLPFASGNDIINKVGLCTFEQQEKRIPKATYTFQYFKVLDELNKIRVGLLHVPLEPSQKEEIVKHIFQPKKIKNKIPSITYGDLRKWMDLDEDVHFFGLTYAPDKSIKEIEKKVFVNVKEYYELRKIVLNYTEFTGEEYSPSDYDTFAFALTVYKTDKDIQRYLSKSGYPDELISKLMNVSFQKFGHLSMKALNKIVPMMQMGRSYTEAVELLGYTSPKQEVKKMLLPVVPNEINNPVVKRALSQTRKIINAIIKKYGSPISIHIELARELSKTHDERRKLTNEQGKNHGRNTGALTVLIENGILNPSGFDIVRYKLWKEQNETCAYSLKQIPPTVFFAELRRERNSAPILDVDHIIPYSQSFEDSYNNKVLVFSDENRKKGNRIPYDYLMERGGWNLFKQNVEMNKEFSGKKKSFLLKKEFSARESDLIKERHLNDTRYITSFMKNFIENNLLFKQTEVPLRKKVQTVNGKITSHFRSRWGFEKVRSDTYLHHALDAIVVACTDQYMVTRVTEYYKEKETMLRRKKLYFPLPWVGFREEVLTNLSIQPVPAKIKQSLENGTFERDYTMVSRTPRRSATGEAHKETIFKKGRVDEKTGKTFIIQRLPLSKIPFDKNGDFPMVGKESDPATYHAIKNRFIEYGMDANSAFVEPLFKPSKRGQKNQIKKVQIEDKPKTYVREVNGGVAANGNLVRADIFHKDNKYFAIPIYVFDTTLSELPNKIIKAGKGIKKWPSIDDSYQFKFSLHPYDLIRIVAKDKDTFLYFISLDISTGNMECKEINIPSVIKDNRFSLGGINLLEKYQTSILGDICLVHEEKRLPFK
ncbi:CRISPR-associated endonuclease Csn1 [Peribacillus simplex]|uniref:type II CRISPR RNA-guided endonuclease Cas9 n=1 Tax=Peribacillus simplex TaxID=1478 RepID=UPI0024E269AB|nr:type II CRISPR RNA-guided endonuclease Cas9 [Peribacillus simplex]MDF9763829.1 CRISPR-associated endonuclease Csn1 [Peribacillus simplex]